MAQTLRDVGAASWNTSYGPMKLSWQIIGTRLEFMLNSPTSGYVALGWCDPGTGGRRRAAALTRLTRVDFGQ